MSGNDTMDCVPEYSNVFYEELMPLQIVNDTPDMTDNSSSREKNVDMVEVSGMYNRTCPSAPLEPRHRTLSTETAPDTESIENVYVHASSKNVMVPAPPSSPDWQSIIANLDRDLARQRALSKPIVPDNNSSPEKNVNMVDVAGMYNRTCPCEPIDPRHRTLSTTTVHDTASLFDAKENDYEQSGSKNDKAQKTPQIQQMDRPFSEGAPRKPFASLRRILQKPKTLFNTSDARRSDCERAFPVGNNKFVTVNKYRNRKMVHIRTFFRDSHNVNRPTKRGLVLTPHEWRNLTLVVRDVNSALSE